MKNGLSIRSLSQAAWADFCKDWISWLVLSAMGIILMAVSYAADYYLFEYRNIIPFVFCFFGAMFTALLHQNGLDAAYGRPLHMFRVNSSILFASLFFIAVSLYHPLFDFVYTGLVIFSQDVQWYLELDWVYQSLLNLPIHLFIAYLLARCMFVGMIILEEKAYVLDAFRKSFKLTKHHIFMLLGLFLYLAIVLVFGAATVIGYFIALPYTILMKALLFKKLNEMVK